jgi:hypothetical protein
LNGARSRLAPAIFSAALSDKRELLIAKFITIILKPSKPALKMVA